MFSDLCLKYLFLRKTKGEKQSLEIGPGREKRAVHQENYDTTVMEPENFMDKTF